MIEPRMGCRLRRDEFKRFRQQLGLPCECFNHCSRPQRHCRRKAQSPDHHGLLVKRAHHNSSCHDERGRSVFHEHGQYSKYWGNCSKRRALYLLGRSRQHQGHGWRLHHEEHRRAGCFLFTYAQHFVCPLLCAIILLISDFCRRGFCDGPSFGKSKWRSLLFVGGDHGKIDTLFQ